MFRHRRSFKIRLPNFFFTYEKYWLDQDVDEEKDYAIYSKRNFPFIASKVSTNSKIKFGCNPKEITVIFMGIFDDPLSWWNSIAIDHLVKDNASQKLKGWKEKNSMANLYMKSTWKVVFFLNKTPVVDQVAYSKGWG